jgi:hypothetical protein
MFLRIFIRLWVNFYLVILLDWSENLRLCKKNLFYVIDETAIRRSPKNVCQNDNKDWALKYNFVTILCLPSIRLNCKSNLTYKILDESYSKFEYFLTFGLVRMLKKERNNLSFGTPNYFWHVRIFAFIIYFLVIKFSNKGAPYLKVYFHTFRYHSRLVTAPL